MKNYSLAHIKSETPTCLGLQTFLVCLVSNIFLLMNLIILVRIKKSHDRHVMIYREEILNLFNLWTVVAALAEEGGKISILNEVLGNLRITFKVD